MNVLSLFSGVGGFDLGLEAAGMKTIYQCEWDKHAMSILNKHWPHVPKWGDISTLTGKEILKHGTPPDIVAWGSPCQDLSVAGKRAGLEGERSGLFHQGMRIIRELRKETNNEYPRISIWENVAGALSSNNGADFGQILYEMAQAGACFSEWSLLDAQHFGIPQRRRRVFLISIFDPRIANQCPSPLLPVSESLRGNTAKGKPKRESAARTLTEGAGGDGAIVNAIGASIYHKSTVVNQDVNSGHLVINEENPILIDRAAFNQGENAAYEPYISDEPVIPSLIASGPHAVFTESRRAQTSTDDETWVQSEVNPTLNSFDVGDTQATTAIVEPMLIDGTRVDDVRVYEPPVQTLKERMGTGGNNVPMLAFNTQFGSNANVTENIAPTLKGSQQAPSVAYGIQGNVIGRQDHNGPAGKGHTEEGDAMFTLTSADVHAVIQYDGYNQRVYEDDIALTIRIGRDSSDCIAQPTEPTMAVRRLTPLECERLMGWPDNWTEGQADTHRYKQCGNGVASPVAKWIAQQILNI